MSDFTSKSDFSKGSGNRMSVHTGDFGEQNTKIVVVSSARFRYLSFFCPLFIPGGHYCLLVPLVVPLTSLRVNLQDFLRFLLSRNEKGFLHVSKRDGGLQVTSKVTNPLLSLR